MEEEILVLRIDIATLQNQILMALKLIDETQNNTKEILKIISRLSE